MVTLLLKLKVYVYIYVYVAIYVDIYVYKYYVTFPRSKTHFSPFVLSHPNSVGLEAAKKLTESLLETVSSHVVNELPLFKTEVKEGEHIEVYIFHRYSPPKVNTVV